MEKTDSVKLYLAPTVSELAAFLGALPRGERNLVFCEDRLTLEAERALARAGGTVLDTSVTTFARFLRGVNTKKVLSKQGSVLACGAVAAACAGELECFGRNPAGCAGRLYETIAQLRAAKISPAALEGAAESAEPYLAAKLRDLARVYRGYLAFLGDGYVDESGVLELLPAAVRAADLAETNVYFAGFPSFTGQAAEGIRAALACAKGVAGVFVGGEAALYTNEAVRDFERLCALAGYRCERVGLPSSLSEEAEQLRCGLFDPVRRAPLETARVHLYAAADAEEEAAYIAAAIKREVLDGGLRYNEIAVYVPDLSAYALPLEKAFGEYKIPYYADVRRSIAKHPLAQFVLRWLSVPAEGFDPADVDAFLGNAFFGGDAPSREAYRNYLLKYANFRGGVKKELKETAEQPLVFAALRARVLSAFEGVRASMTGAEYCRAARAVLEQFGCEQRQEELAAALEEEGMRADAAFAARGYEGVVRVLSEAEALAGGQIFAAEEFAALLAEGFAGLEVSLIPQYLDAVFVGGIAESRRAGAKVVLAAGMTDAVPPAGADTALLSDRDIDRLRGLAVELAPKIREVNARARETVALALCGFSERLYLTCPQAERGEAKKPGEVFVSVRSLFTAGGKALPVHTRASLERRERTDAAAFLRYLGCVCSEETPAVRALLRRADGYRRGRENDFSAYAGVYAALRERGDAPAQLLFGERRAADFVPAAGDAVFRGRNAVYPTLAEGYFRCPYRNFAEQGLLLREREEQSVRSADTGNFLHEVLRRLAEAMPSFADAGACEAFAREQAERLLAEPPYSYLADTRTGGYSARTLVRDTVIVCRNVYEQVAGSSFTVSAAEQTFGYPSSPYPGITILHGERPVRLVGKIDRVDSCGEYVRVVDYKTGQFGTSAEEYYTGRRLQLALYLAAVSQGRKPAGAYYFPARVGFSAESEDAPFRMQGYTAAGDEVVRLSDSSAEEGKKSRFIDASLGGRKSRRRLSEGDFEAFVSYSVLAARKCAEETAEGCIAASPYEGACEYCPYGGVCGYDPSAGARREKNVTEQEIVRIAREGRSHG